MLDRLQFLKWMILVSLTSACTESKTVVKRDSRPSDQTEDPPQFLDNDESEVIAHKGGRASLGDASVDIAAHGLAKDARVSIRRLSRDQLNDAAAAELSAGSEFFEVKLIDLDSGDLLSDSDLLLPVSFSNLVADGVDTKKLYFKFVTPVDSSQPTSGVIDNSTVKFKDAETRLHLVESESGVLASADLRHSSFVISAISPVSRISRSSGSSQSGASGASSGEQSATNGAGGESSGDNADGQGEAPSARVQRLSLSEETTCAHSLENQIKCWGSATGSTGIWSGSSTPNLLTPSVVDYDKSFKLAAIGDQHSCALDPDASIWCWGNNSSINPEGCCAPEKTSDQTMNGAFVDIASGLNHSCAIKHNELLYCWGDNSSKQLGTTASSSATPLVVGSASWKDISAGKAHSCGIQTNGSLWCWGENQWGTIGDGTTTDRAEPTRVGTGTDWLRLGRGALAEHQCAIKQNKSVWCWGLKMQGQVGHISLNERVPQQVGSQIDWIDAAMGWQSSCGIRENGTLWCWGNADFGGSDPIQVGDAQDWTSIAVGGAHYCGTKTDDSIWCWGDNDRGQVGNGTTIRAILPVKINGI